LASFVGNRVGGAEVLLGVLLHVAKDQVKGCQPLLAIDQLPFLLLRFVCVVTQLHDYRLQAVVLACAVPDIVEQDLDVRWVPSVAALIAWYEELPAYVPYGLMF